MKSGWPRPSVAALLLLTTLISSCATVEGRLSAAAAQRGTAQAAVELPPLPDDCRKQEPHAEIAEGREIGSVLIRERAALDRQNARGARCIVFYDELKTGMAQKRTAK